MTVIPIIIEQHAEDAAFHWLLRDSAVHAPHRGERGKIFIVDK